jgi:Domain of unknown function (DUF4932)
MFVTLLLSLGLVSATPRAAHVATNCSDRTAAVRPRVDVHPGMELIAIMAWLAGRYPTPPDSKYKSDVWQHFARFRNHPSLAVFREGQLYPDFTETGLWLTTAAEPVLTLPDSSSWYASMGRARVAAMLNGVRQFGRDTHFAAFRARHRAAYAAWSLAVGDELQRSGAMTAVETFYRCDTQPASGPAVQLFLEPLNGWGAHMITLPAATGTPKDDVVRFQIGPRDTEMLPDSPLRFTVSRSVVEIAWHEAGHSFVRALMRGHASDIAALARLFDSTNTNLRRQNVRTWQYAFEENLVRAVVAAMIGESRGTSAMNAAIAEEVGGGFVWVPLLTDLLRREYQPQRNAFPTLDSFASRITEALATRQSVADAPRAPE